MNTTETNKKLAEFLGWENIKETYLNMNLDSFIVPSYLAPSPSYLNLELEGGEVVWKVEAEYLDFHKDWNWIMLVANKIEKTNEGTLIIQSKGVVDISFKGETFSFHSNNLIGNVYEACGMFVDWWNNQKP